jgi:DUF4097 and DUF4098 domain-containing protein YvlB
MIVRNEWGAQLKRLTGAAIFCLTVVSTISGCTRYSSVATETHSIPQGCTLAVYTFNGSISVEWFEGSEMSLEITRTSFRSVDELEKAEVIVTSGPLSIVEARKLEPDADVGVNLVLKLPFGTEISDLQTSNGRIVVSGGSGSAEASTSNGSISFEDFSGTVRAETSNGAISVSGSELLYARSSNGSITGEISSIPQGGIAIRTSNGSIRIEVDQDLDADFEMDTSNGSVNVSGDGFTEIRIDDSQGSAVLGEGGEPVTLDTSNGSINVTALH